MNRTFIIAEAGVNHNGDLPTALEMVRVAKECGVDAVKFQTFQVDELVSENAAMADYQKKNLASEHTNSQKEMLSRLALEDSDFGKIADFCGEIGIRFLSTPFDVESIHFLSPMQDLWKIPSGSVTDYPYLVEVAKTGKEIILSTGMCTMDEVHEAWDVLKKNGCGEITLLHCTTEYPAPLETVNLKAMHTLQDEFGCPVGYSDHTKGIEVPIAAVAMGATVIEKHFTLDRNMEGPDHAASLEPKELKAMVDAIRSVETAIGDGRKNPSEAELKNRIAARKSIVAKCDIACGDILSEENLTTKRPGNGISPMLWNEVIGKKAIRDFKMDELIEI
ncbi:MAG: N-acetylneuraminate synthase [Lachnospiraceae bacterium]|nr:N-acetylneuraminate synthase [Lachnospiraceae bacterium]